MYDLTKLENWVKSLKVTDSIYRWTAKPNNLSEGDVGVTSFVLRLYKMLGSQEDTAELEKYLKQLQNSNGIFINKWKESTETQRALTRQSYASLLFAGNRPTTVIAIAWLMRNGEKFQIVAAVQ